MQQRTPIVVIVIPCHNEAVHIESVIAGIGTVAARIVCVDDGSTDDTASIVTRLAEQNPRIHLVRREANGGVGAAMCDGYRAALEEDADIVVKMDGDGQMHPSHLTKLLRPILDGEADYVNGNRFFEIDHVRSMPAGRVIANIALSFATKLSSGYWNLFDPANGYTAIHAAVLRNLPLDKIAKGYFFESDMLFRLSILRAAIVQIPMPSRYGIERSDLNVPRSIVPFAGLTIRNLFKRIVYNYLLRNFSVASIYLAVGLMLFLAGSGFGLWRWIALARAGVAATAGTVMLAALPMLIGAQLLIGFVSYDITNTPAKPIFPFLER